MSIKADRWIRRMVLDHEMISPFVDEQVSRGVISFGLSSYGYDVRVSNIFKIFTNVNSAIVDPKKFDERAFVEVVADSILIPPNSFVLATSVESFKVPRNITCLCIGKSSYARCGIQVGMTPFEAGWRGQPTLEIFNATPLPAKIYANEGICQVVFFEGDEYCETSYEDRKGKYQDQVGVTLPKVK